jgi:hypothetical protein
LFGGGDRDYDDNVFKFTGGIAPLACPPDVTVPTDSGACSGEQNPQGNIAGLIFVPVGFASAKVNYTVPSVPGATVNCVPPPGSAFPVGTNSVTCTANYTRGDVVTCSFTVVVVPGRGVKECVKAQLDALLTTVTDKKDRAALIEAADDDLAESLAPQLWLDQLHLDRKLGGTVFQEERETSKILCALMKKNNSHISAALLQSYIDQLILVDRTIALIAINEAAAAGVPAKTIKNALKDLAKGDAEIHGDKCYKAFDFYKSAWKQVQLAPH